ncbi:hypothetical protein TSOC_000442 [Tetrabaena socialis]|uniref:Uncharacterized protein n=1 Tax=Tetrabaena socialis TaxID=47790 RepID=A0A2J8AJC0_9CHLO|nr:hypothetical protein TSOC_000442 [Tetrabaena socialis]|eukprot:PNH12626.1 hypothetical protein TSOC_000442 [Tetrabaena socialis]
MPPAATHTPRRRPGLPLGLQLRRAASGQSYWAVVASQSMPSKGVDVLAPYEESWQRAAKGSLPVTFADELAPAGSPVADDLECYTVHITKEWLSRFFIEPQWEELERSDCRVLGVTVGIMTGLLPREGVPVRLGQRGGAATLARASRLSGVAPLVRSLLPILLINLAVVAGMWVLARWVERQALA